jgi:hypothetical protein
VSETQSPIVDPWTALSPVPSVTDFFLIFVFNFFIITDRRTLIRLIPVPRRARPWPWAFFHRHGPGDRSYLRFAFLADLVARSAARRLAVRFCAAAVDAFLAREVRSSAVMVSRLRLPPLEPIAAIACRIISGVIALPISL